MASGTLTLTTQSVDYGGGRGGMTMYNTINWSTSGNTLTLSNGGRSGGDYWTLYNASGSADYMAVLKIQVNYGSGWTTISEQSAYIGTVAQGGLRIGAKSDEFLNNLGSYTLTGNCSIRALYYATREPAPTSDYPYAFPSESYSEASQTPVVVDVVVAPDTPTITNVIPSNHSVTFDYGTTSFGIPSTGNVWLSCLSQYAVSSVFTITSKTTTGMSTETITKYSDGFLKKDIVGNTIYFLGATADNGSATAATSPIQFVTLPNETAVSIVSISDTSILIRFTAPANGGARKQYFEYSIDGGKTWETYAQSSSTKEVGWNEEISNLTSNTEYTILTRTRTTAGVTPGATLTVTTSTPSNPVISEFEASNGSVSSTAGKFDYSLEAFSGYPVPATKTITATDSNGTIVYTNVETKSGYFDEHIWISDNVVYNEQYSLTCRVENSTGYDEETIIGSTCYAPLEVVYNPSTKKVIITCDPGAGYCGIKIKYKLDDGSAIECIAIPSGTTTSQSFELDVSQLAGGSHTLHFVYTKYDSSDPYVPFINAPAFTFNIGVRLYGSKNTNDLAEKLIKVYAPVNELSKSLKVYGSKNTNNLAKLIHEK